MRCRNIEEIQLFHSLARYLNIHMYRLTVRMIPAGKGRSKRKKEVIMNRLRSALNSNHDALAVIIGLAGLSMLGSILASRGLF